MKLISILAATALALAPAAVAAGPAQAATVVYPGLAWSGSANPPPGVEQTPDKADYCSLAAVGTDSSGNKVAFTAQHCLTTMKNGDPVYIWAPTAGRTLIGNLEYSNQAMDFAVFRINPDVVLDADNPAGVRVDSLGTQPRFGTENCKIGARSGKTCGRATGGTSTTNLSTASIAAGDSGGAQVVGTKWVGIVQANFLFINTFVRVDGPQGVLAKVNAQANPVGKGFVPTTS